MSATNSITEHNLRVENKRLRSIISNISVENTMLETENIRLRRTLKNMSRKSGLGDFVSKFVDDFTVRGLLGQGGFGCVFKAENRFDGWEYAVKRIPVDSSDQSLGDALSEVRLMGQLDHPGVIRYNSMWIEQPPNGWQVASDVELLNKMGATTDSLNITYRKDCVFLYIQMQMCKCSLEVWLEENRTAASRSLSLMKNWFKQMVSAIAYIHEMNLIHRDLKPSNILFVDEDRLKICDLGIATERKANEGVETEWTRTSTGTALYMSPEQRSWMKRYSSKTDVFSLGLILAEMCVVMTPDERNMIFDIYRRGLQADIISDAETASLIAEITQLEPSDRPSCKEILERLNLTQEAYTRF